MSRLYPDSKTFVDKKLRHSPGKIVKKFEELVKSNDGKALTKEQIKEARCYKPKLAACTL